MGIVERMRGWQAAEAPPQGRTAPDAVSDMHEAADLIERLKGYAVHDEECDINGWLPRGDGPCPPCTCGLSALIKEIEGD